MIAIIPARDGSKSIINKNLQILGKKRLVDHAIEYAKSLFFEKVILSTDIPTLLDEELGVHKRVRPPELCTDEALMSDVVLDVIKSYHVNDGQYIWLLQPTSPFRTKSNAYEIKEILERDKPDSLISVTDIGANHPNRTYTIKNNHLFPLRFTNFQNKQDLKPIYIRNGCFYIVKAGEFLKRREFHMKPCTPYIMSEDQSVNIDCKRDLLLARAMYGQQY